MGTQRDDHAGEGVPARGVADRLDRGEAPGQRRRCSGQDVVQDRVQRRTAQALGGGREVGAGNGVGVGARRFPHRVPQRITQSDAAEQVERD